MEAESTATGQLYRKSGLSKKRKCKKITENSYIFKQANIYKNAI